MRLHNSVESYIKSYSYMLLPHPSGPQLVIISHPVPFESHRIKPEGSKEEAHHSLPTAFKEIIDMIPMA